MEDHHRHFSRALWALGMRFMHLVFTLHLQSDTFLGLIIQFGRVMAYYDKMCHKRLVSQKTVIKSITLLLNLLIKYYSQIVTSQLPSTKCFFLAPPRAVCLLPSQNITLALILVQPEPAKQFIIEVDASDFEQCSPSAYISWHLTLAEVNYDLSNHKLQAVSL